MPCFEKGNTVNYTGKGLDSGRSLAAGVRRVSARPWVADQDGKSRERPWRIVRKDPARLPGGTWGTRSELL